RVAVFVGGAGIFAPFASSFLDAAVVTSLRGESYWLVWRTRFFSNVLTEIVLVSAVVIAITSFRIWIRRGSLALIAEAALVILGLFVAGAPTMAAHGGATVLDVGPTPVALFLPFIFWAAVRFGPAGASMTLFITTLIVIWAETHVRGTVPILPRA